MENDTSTASSTAPSSQPLNDAHLSAMESQETYFTGSSRAEDYFVDLSVPAKEWVLLPALLRQRQPIDIQAYLQCIGEDLRRRTAPWDEGDVTTAESRYGLKPYIPVMELVHAGLVELKAASKRDHLGIWLDISDITPDDMARFPHNPWLASLIRLDRLPKLARDIEEHYNKQTTSRHPVVYGNVRIAFPTHLVGPDMDSAWLKGTKALYGYGDHPVVAVWKAHKEVMAHREPVGDPRLLEDLDPAARTLDELTDADVVIVLRYIVSGVIWHTSEPVLPLTAEDQADFDNDPGEYYQMIVNESVRGLPVTHLPRGWDDYVQKMTERRQKYDRTRAQE